MAGNGGGNPIILDKDPEKLVQVVGQSCQDIRDLSRELSEVKKTVYSLERQQWLFYAGILVVIIQGVITYMLKASLDRIILGKVGG